VSYGERSEAELAIQHLDKQAHLPGALCPLEVRFAKSHHYIQAGPGPKDNRCCFYSNAPTQLAEEDIVTFFSQFGVVEEINLFRERKTNKSKGSGFVTMQTREQALKAIETMEGEPEGTMQVKWADPELQAKKKKAVDESNADNRMLFFAKVLRSATEEEVRMLFSGFGKVYDVNLFRAFQGAPTTKGCGLVTMGMHEEAVNAIDHLDSKFVWEGMESPMVVKWMDAALQRRRREQHLAAMRQGLVPNMTMGNEAWVPAGMALPSLPDATRMSMMPMFVPTEPELSETPPTGCAQDAIKLFIGNIPKQCTEEQLLPFFETIGKVVELVIVRDKVSHESKGSAFVWYSSRAHAERAILQFNLRHVLPDPSGEQDRPLVVRKAKARAKAAAAHGAGATPATAAVHPAVGMLTGGIANGGAGLAFGPGAPAGFYNAGAHGLGLGPAGGMIGNHMVGSTGNGLAKVQAAHMGNGMVPQGMDGLPLAMQGMAPMAQAAYTPAAAGPPATSAPFRALHSAGAAAGATGPMGAQLVSIQGAPTVQDTGLYEAYGAGPNDTPLDPYLGQNGMDNLAMSIPINQQQLALANSHLYSIQTMSGATMQVSPGAPGLFHLVMSGTRAQLEAAQKLVASVVG